MRLTLKLYAQHLGWYFKQQWKRVGQRLPIETGALAELQSLGLTVEDVRDNFKSNVQERSMDSRQSVSRPDLDITNLAYVLNDETVILEGLKQAQSMLNTITVDKLPQSLLNMLETMIVPSHVHDNIKSAVLFSHLFDSERKKLSREKNLERPAFVLPRKYGITYRQRNHSLTSRLIHECAKLCANSVALQKHVVQDLICNLNQRTEKAIFQFDFKIEAMITSRQPLSTLNIEINEDVPDIFPLKNTISIPNTKHYQAQTSFPLTPLTHPHTLLLDFSPEYVRNTFETDVKDIQLQARNMLKAFSVAAARAKQLYGDEILNLKMPVVIQSVHTNGKHFHFGVFQLNTLDFNQRNEKRNYWFHEPTAELFQDCKYELGQPVLRGYNDKILKMFYAFYCNN